MEPLSHIQSHFLTVARKHYGLPDAQFFQLCYGYGTIFLYLVVDDDMTCIRSIDGYVDDSSHIVGTGVPFGSCSIHHLSVSHAYDFTVNLGSNALASYFFHISGDAAVGGFIRESIPQSCSNRMGGEMFNMGSQMQKLMFILDVGMYGFYGELSMGKCSCLIEDHSIQMCQSLHVVASFYQNTIAGSTTYSSEKSEWYGDDQSAGTRYDEEHQSPIEPGREVLHEGSI